MERGSLGTRESIGDFVLRDHGTDLEVDKPIGLVGAAMDERSYEKGIRTKDGWNGDINGWLYAPTGGKDALHHSTATSSAADEVARRGIGIWGQLLPAVYATEGLRILHDGQAADPRMQPWVDVTALPPGAIEGDGEAQFVTMDRRLPRGGEVGVVLPGTDESTMRSLFMPMRKLVAQHEGPNGPFYSEPVYEIIPEDSDPIGRIDHSRAAGLHSAIRVVSLQSEEQQDEKPYLYQLALYGGVHPDDGSGNLMMSGPTIVDNRYGKRTCERGSVAAGDEPESLTENVNAAMWVSGGGPLHPRFLDKGYINTDGEPVTVGGLSTRSIFCDKRLDRDGPLKFEMEPKYPDSVAEHDVETDVHLRYFCQDELWRWMTTTPFEPNTPPDAPPTINDDPPPTIEDDGGGPPEGIVTSGRSGPRVGGGGGSGTGGPGGNQGGQSGGPGNRSQPGSRDQSHDERLGDGWEWPDGHGQGAFDANRGIWQPDRFNDPGPIIPLPGAGGQPTRSANEHSVKSLEFEVVRESDYMGYDGRFGWQDGTTGNKPVMPCAGGIWSRGSVDAAGDFEYLDGPIADDPQAVWRQGTASKQYLGIGPAFVLPDGPSDQSDWVSGDSVVGFYNGWASAGSADATSVGWVDWDPATGVPIDGPLLSIEGASGSHNLVADFVDASGSQRGTGVSNTSAGAFVPALAEYVLGAAEKPWSAHTQDVNVYGTLNVTGTIDASGATISGTIGGRQDDVSTTNHPATIALSGNVTTLRVSQSGLGPASSLGTLTGGQDGQLLAIVNVHASNTFTITHDTATADSFTQTAGANRTLAANGGQGLYRYDAGLSTANWVQIT